jgi:CRP-like cAMP-binding protein
MTTSTPTAEVAGELARHYLFSALAPEELGRVAQASARRHLERGEVLFEQGQRATHFFLVSSGHVKLYRLSPSGQEKVVDIMGPRRTFAEAVMFMQGGTYPVFAESLEGAEVIAVENATFQDVLRHSADTSFRLMAAMSVHLHDLVSEVEGLTLHNASYRVVSYLLHDEAGGGTVHLDLPKHAIAGLLSMKPETFSRVLASLRDQGLVEVQGQSIVLRDREGLRRLLRS